MERHRLWMAVAIALAALSLLSVPAEAVRPWNPQARSAPPPQDPLEAARDYAHIINVRSASEMVSVQWLAPPTNPDDPLWQTLLDEAIVIGVTHAAPNGEGAIASRFDETPEASDLEGRPLKLLDATDMPPDLAKFIETKNAHVRDTVISPEVFGSDPTIQALFKAYQAGFRFFAFANGGVHACTKGGLAVHFAGERYTFDTPFPGCSAQPPAPDHNKAN